MLGWSRGGSPRHGLASSLRSVAALFVSRGPRPPSRAVALWGSASGATFVAGPGLSREAIAARLPAGFFRWPAKLNLLAYRRTKKFGCLTTLKRTTTGAYVRISKPRRVVSPCVTSSEESL